MFSEKINLAIVDDHTLLRKTLKNYISEHPNINVVIQSPDIPDLLSKIKNNTIDVLLLDLYLPDFGGIEAVKLIKSRYSDVKILVLSMITDVELLNDLLDAGVYGILSITDEPEELIEAIVSIAEQRIYRNKLFTEAMYYGKQHNVKKHSDTAKITLSEREKEVLQLLWEEKSNKEIASHLFLSVRSVEKIRQDMKEKLGTRSTIGLLKYAIAEKIIQLNTLHQFNLMQS